MFTRTPRRIPETENRIIQAYESHSKTMGLLEHDFPFDFFSRGDDGSYHLEYNASGKMSLVATERGKETDRKETYELDELMYWIFSMKAGQIGLNYELNNRHPSDDFRRIYFAKALEEIGKISPAWQERLEREYEEILLQHPFEDDTLRIE